MVDRSVTIIFWRNVFVSVTIPIISLLTFTYSYFKHRYVAMHSMQEDDQGHSGHDENPGNGYLDGNHRRDSRQKSGRSLRLVLAAVAGMLLPLLTQIGHAH